MDMRKLFCMPLIVLIVLVWATVAIAEDVAPVPGADEVVAKDVPDDWYGLAEAQGGGLWNFDGESWAPYLAVPVGGYRELTGVVGAEFDVDESTDAKGIVAAVGGITYHVGTLKDFGVDTPWAKHFGLNVGLYTRYDFDTQEFEQGVMIGGLDLSFGNGNATKQRSR